MFIQVGEGYKLSGCTLHIRAFYSLTQKISNLFSGILLHLNNTNSRPCHCLVINRVRPAMSMQLALKASLPVDRWQWLKAIFLPEDILRDSVESQRKCLLILSEKKEERWNLWFTLYAAFCNQVIAVRIRILSEKAHQNSTLASEAVPFKAASQSSRGVSLFSF